MVNKRGWLRIVEASIAILIIMAVLLIVSQRTAVRTQTDLSVMITPILEEIAKNVTLREVVINDNNESNYSEMVLRGFIAQRLKDPNIGYDLKICNYQDVCGLDTYPKDAKGNVYSGGRIISSTLDTEGTGPKKVQIFLWMRE
jgi:hypothetical protein